MMLASRTGNYQLAAGRSHSSAVRQRLSEPGFHIASISEIFVRGGVAGIQVQRFGELASGAIVIAQEKINSSRMQLQAGKEWVELVGALNLPERFISASK